MEKLSISLEDYIEAIYTQVLKNGFAKVTEISKILDVKKASVTGALNTLLEKNLINYAPYSPITLTKKGEEIAKKVLEKHQKISEFFIQILGLSKNEALETACKMEHIVSEKLFENIVEFSEFINSYAKNNDDFNEGLKKLY